MRIEYLHASKYGNGATVAEEFTKDMADRGVSVTVHHIHDVKPAELAAADLYLFSSPGRLGKPIKGMRTFLKDVQLPAGTRYALLTTEMGPKPDKKTGQMPTEEEICRYQKVRPIMNELLQDKGLIEVAEEKVYVTNIKGPLEDGWQQKVEAFVRRIPVTAVTPMTLKALVGSGDKIGLFLLPFVLVGLLVTVAVPTLFDVGGPSDALRAISIVVLIPGVTIWIWSVVLILVKVPRGELITTGPFALVKHPLYTAVPLLVLPWLGFLLNTWLGAALGIVMYLAARRYAPAEEAVLAETFGPSWDEYRASVKIPWL